MPNPMRFSGSLYGEYHDFEIDVDAEPPVVRDRLLQIQNIMKDGGQVSNEDRQWAWDHALRLKELMNHTIRPL